MKTSTIKNFAVVLFAFALVFANYHNVNAQVDRYWVGTSMGGDNNWSTDASWLDNGWMPGAPEAGDNVFFDPGWGDEDCTIDISTPEVASITVVSEFTSTISQNSITSTSGEFTMEAGTWTQSNKMYVGNTTTYSGTFTISGGTFTGSGSTSYQLYVNGGFSQSGGIFVCPKATYFRRNFAQSSGTFTHNSSTVYLDAYGTSAQTISNSPTFYNLRLSPYTPSAQTTFTISSTITVAGTLTLVTLDAGSARYIAINSGTIDLEGNMSVLGLSTSTNGGGTGTINFTGAAATHTFTYSGTCDSARLCNVKITATTGAKTLSIGATDKMNIAGNLTLAGTQNIDIDGGPIFWTGSSILLQNSGSGGGGTGKIYVNGTGAQAITSSVSAGQSLLPDITLAKEGNTLSMSGTISMDGDWTYVKGTVSAGTSTVSMGTGTLDPQGSPTTMTFNNLTCRGTATLAGNMDVNGTLTIGGSGGLVAGGYTINCAGNWVNDGTFTANTSSFIFDGTTAISGSSAPTFNNCQVNAACVLTIDRTVSMANLTLKSPSSDAPTGSLIDNSALTVTGTSTMERYCTGSRWWYMSSPTNNENTGAFDAAGEKVYIYNPATAAWVRITDNVTSLVTGKGYSNKFAAAKNVTYDGGTFHTGNKSIGLGGQLDAADGWNLVGNPFPSAVDWDAGGWTKTTVRSNTFYFRTNGAYASYNGNTKVGTGGATNIIPPCQGIWLKDSTDAGGTLTVPQAARVHDVSTNFLKDNKADKSDSPVISRLNIISSNGPLTDETVICFVAPSSKNADGFDSEKLFITDANY
ncbi:MAG: hypothetical protein KKD31_14115, partial [Bacteroidetes bacterium]|nr:hypothetical protein [Bacteroidota bacterium]